MSKLKIPGILAAALSLLSFPAAAHHSFAAYDMSKTVTVQATIREFDWGAPHSSGSFMYTSPHGKISMVTLVAASPNSFAKAGFTPHDFRPGTKVTLSYNPLRNGDATGGSLSGLVLPDGRKFEFSLDKNGPPIDYEQPKEH